MVKRVKVGISVQPMTWDNTCLIYIMLNNFAWRFSMVTDQIVLEPSLILVDINECTTNNICEHSCHNIWGSYQCRCRPGYRLAADKRSCNGKLICYCLSHLPAIYSVVNRYACIVVRLPGLPWPLRGQQGNGVNNLPGTYTSCDVALVVAVDVIVASLHTIPYHTGIWLRPPLTP